MTDPTPRTIHGWVLRGWVAYLIFSSVRLSVSMPFGDIAVSVALLIVLGFGFYHRMRNNRNLPRYWWLFLAGGNALGTFAVLHTIRFLWQAGGISP